MLDKVCERRYDLPVSVTATAATAGYRLFLRRVLGWTALVLTLLVPTLAEALHTCHLPSRVPWIDVLSVGRVGWQAPDALCPGCLLGKVMVSSLPPATSFAVSATVSGAGAVCPTGHPVQAEFPSAPARAPPLSW